MKNNAIYLVIAAAVLFWLGFFIGRRSIVFPEPIHTSDTVYVNVPVAVHDTIDRPVPVKEYIDKISYVPVPVSTDTTALFNTWKDYHLTRNYDLDFSNDTLGTFKVSATVNQNKLINSVSTIQPRVKVITNTDIIYKTQKIQPWIMATTSTDFKVQVFQGGIDLNQKYMISVGGIRIDDKWGATFGLGIKF